MEAISRPRVPALMLSDATQSLICDVFEKHDLFRDAPRMERRLVAWGRDAEPIALPHSAVVISEQKLTELIKPESSGFSEASPEPAWTILASPPLPAASVEHHFGTRVASAVMVSLSTGCDAGACFVEGLESGWLFLIPGADRCGWLLAVGGETDTLLKQSRLVAPQIAGTIRATGQFPAYPRISDPPCGAGPPGFGWLACGTTALSFDPLCGDGTGNAIREAILAAAVVRASLADRADQDSLLAHYRARLLAGFYRHLELTREFYGRGHSGPWWDLELSHIIRGIEYCKAQMDSGLRFRYHLTGFDLQPIR